MVEPQTLWMAAAGSLVLGILVGVLIARAGSRREAARAQHLEEQLRVSEAEHTRYRGQVSEHFGETSRRLRDLTLQYKSVYEHLADGARTLCPEGSIEIAPSLAEAALPIVAGRDLSDESGEDDSQLDLELEPPDRWAAAAREDDDDLGPLLDEDASQPAAKAAS
jgi:uncharacterized membrane-anchored protein YhcB (DUF1043 family)